MMVVKKYILSTSVIIPSRSASELFYCTESSKWLRLVWHLLRDRQGLQAWPLWQEVIVLISLLSCSPGEWAGRYSSAARPSFKAIISVLSLSPTPMCHHRTDVIDEQGLLTPLMREVLIHVDLVWDPQGRVCRDAVTSAPSHPLPPTFHLLKTFAAQPRELSFSVY